MNKRFLKKRKTIFELIKKADYKKALDLAAKLANENKDCVFAQATYASVLGDFAEFNDTTNSKSLKKKAAKLLYKLTRRLKNQDIKTVGYVRNEYYYHSGQFKKQYELGCELARRGATYPYYTQGVGASNYAYQLALKRQFVKARKWAKKAVQAWKKEIRSRPDYYNSYVHYALALGISGNTKKASEALIIAERLSGKNKDYIEFRAVRDRLKALKPL